MAHRDKVTGRFLARSDDRMDCLFRRTDGVEIRVDPFVGCFVLPNDWDPYASDCADMIGPEDYKIKEDALYKGIWEISGEYYGATFLVHEAPSRKCRYQITNGSE